MVDVGPGRPAGAAVDPDLVEYLMVVVPELGSMSTLAPALADLVASESIRVLDLVCVTRSTPGGELTVVELEDVEALATLESVDGEVGGLLSEHDIETASLALGAGSSAIILLVQDRWAQSLSDAARRAGGRVVGGDRITRPRIEAVLDSTGAVSISGPGESRDGD